MLRQNHDQNYYRIQGAFYRMRDEQGNRIGQEHQRIEQAISTLPRVKALGLLEKASALLWIPAGILAYYQTGLWWAGIGAAIGCAFVLYHLFSKWRLSVRKNAERHLANRLAPSWNAIRQAEAAIKVAEDRYHMECEIYYSYPPDWEDRRRQVFARDNYTCQECGLKSLPLRGRTRGLHLHHKQKLSEGGRNDLGNLITLCHRCHTEVDPDHKRLLSIQPKRRRRRH